MLQQWAMWCTTSNNPDSIQFLEVEYVAGIQRYLEVDDDDPSRTVIGYLNAWWFDEGCHMDFPSYAFDPHDYLEIHRPQVSNMWLIIYLLSIGLARFNSVGKTYGRFHMPPATWLKFN
jgi:hypothetical protein